MELCINNLVRGLFGTTALLVAHMAVAVPIELNAAQFASQTAGLAIIAEDFESFATGAQPNPLTLANGTAIFPSGPYVSIFSGGPYVSADPTTCLNATNCLIDNGDLTNPRTFSALPVGTTYWGTDIYQIQFGGDNTLRVTVVGGSGTLTIEAIGHDFWGFHDALGISSVSFLNLGVSLGSFSAVGNYSFDNVTTASSVPTPSTFTLLAAGALWFGRRTRRPLRSPASVTKEG